MVRMNFIVISSSDTNLLRNESVKQKIKKLWPHCIMSHEKTFCSVSNQVRNKQLQMLDRSRHFEYTGLPHYYKSIFGVHIKDCVISETLL